MALSLLLWLASPRSYKWQWAAVALYVALHLLTLPLFPLPWQDETYNVSLTLSFMESGMFIPKVAYYTTGLLNDVRYGPVFFTLATLFFKVFGVGVFSFRLVSFLSGMGVLWATYRLGKQMPLPEGVLRAGVALLALDPFFWRCMHEGRMDLTALFFMLMAFYHAWLTICRQDWVHAVYTGVLVATALLTTPRVGFLLVGFLPLLVKMRFASWRQQFNWLLAWGGIPFLLYSIWIFYAFSGYATFLAFYKGFAKGYTQAGGFYTFIQPNQYLLIPAALFSALWGITRLGKSWGHPIMVVCGLSLIAFYAVVTDPGPYSVFITPMLYLLLISSLQQKSDSAFA